MPVQTTRHCTQELTAAVPALALEVTLGSRKWVTRSPVSPPLLFVLAMEGHVVRTRPAGSWRSSQYRWAAADRCWSSTPPMGGAAGRAALAARYLETHGPVTLADVRWWTGWTATRARAALADVRAVTVRLDSGDDGYVLPEDVEAAPAVGCLEDLPTDQADRVAQETGALTGWLAASGQRPVSHATGA